MKKQREKSQAGKQRAVKQTAKPKHRDRWNYTRALKTSLHNFFIDDSGIIDYRENHHEG